MAMLFLNEYAEAHSSKRRRQVSFCSPRYHKPDGSAASIAITVVIEDGDVAGVISAVIENGGIGQMDDKGVYHFVPWPCAAVEICEL